MDSHPSNTTLFDHEKLDVYRMALLFIDWVTPLLHQIRKDAPGFHRDVCDQLDRASLSTLLNTAEGNGKRPGQQRAWFFDDARAPAVECAACLDALVAKGMLVKEQIADGKAKLLRIVSMLTKLVARFDRSSGKPRDDQTLYQVEDERREGGREG